jgi:hypothetical protein
MNDTMFAQVPLQVRAHVFTAIVTSEDLDFSIVLTSNQRMKSLKQNIYLTFGLHQVYRGHPGAIIDKRNKPPRTI